jgi:PAS domain-containing protein
MEAQLMRSPEHEFADIARLGGWEWDAATGEVSWSDALYEIAGVPDGFEPSWESYFAIVHPDERSRVERLFRRALAGSGSYTVMHRFLTEGGGERLVLCRARVWRHDDGSPARMAGATLDLTDLQPTAEVHRARHQQLAAAEELAGVGSFEWDIAADRVTWSDNLYRIFGHRPGEFEGTYEAYLSFVHPDDRNERRGALARCAPDRHPRRHRASRRVGHPGDARRPRPTDAVDRCLPRARLAGCSLD